jgi:hypothetical protein
MNSDCGKYLLHENRKTKEHSKHSEAFAEYKHGGDKCGIDGDKYSVVLENERVRVLRYHDKPGERTLQHAYPDYVMYAESSFKRRLAFPDGRKQKVDVKTGSVGWMKGICTSAKT